jgi:subtilisin family serine protease
MVMSMTMNVSAEKLIENTDLSGLNKVAKVTSTDRQDADETQEDQEYKEDEVIIVYEDDMIDTDAVAEAVETNQTEELNETEQALADLGISEQEEIVSADETSGAVAVATLPEDVSVEEAIENLSDTPEIAYVQKNYIYKLESTGKTSVNDKESSSQYYLNNTDAYRAWSLARSDSSSYNKSGKPVTIAVLDTGINYAKKLRHEDLQDVSDGGNVLYSYAYNAVTGKLMSEDQVIWNDQRTKHVNTYNDTLGEGAYVDYLGHGTEVTSVLAATANNGTGIAGVSYNAQVLPINVFGTPEIDKSSYVYTDMEGDYYSYDADCDSKTLITAYKYVLNHASKLNIKVINLSLGGSIYYVDQALQSSINQAYNAGILTIAAAGNDGSEEKMYPASFDHVVSVASLDKNYLYSYFSNYNNAIDVAAPGENIKIAAAGFYYVESGTKGSLYGYGQDKYSEGDGTSYSAPIVSGIAALIFAANPNLTVSQAEHVLEYSAIDLGTSGKDNYYGYGEVNAYHAVLAAKSKLTTSAHYTNGSVSLSNGNLVYKCKNCGDFTFNVKNLLTASLSTSSYTYSGKAKKPSVTVKYNTATIASKKTKTTSKISLSYASGRKNVGTYTVKIKGKGIYTGTVTKTFTIKPVSTKIKSVTKKKKGFTVKWTKKTTQTTGYEIRYSTESSMSDATQLQISKNKTTSKTITGLQSKKKYYVQIRTYKTVSGKTYYSSWSAKKTVTTK